MLLNRKGRRSSAMADLASMSKNFYKNCTNSSEQSTTVIVTPARPLSSLISHFNSKNSETISSSPSQKSVKTFINENKQKSARKSSNLSDAFSQLALSRQNTNLAKPESNNSTSTGSRRVSQLFENINSMKHEQFLTRSQKELAKTPESNERIVPNNTSTSTPKAKLIFDKKETQIKSHNQSLIFNSFYYENKQSYSLSLSDNFLDILDDADDNDDVFKCLNSDLNDPYLTLSTSNKNASNYSLASTDFDDSSTSTDLSTTSVQPLSEISSFNSFSIDLTSELVSTATLDYDDDADRTLNNTLSLTFCESDIKLEQTNEILINSNSDTDQDIDGYSRFILI